jgi:hypothetical protein
MRSFALNFELRSSADDGPTVQRGRFIAAVEPLKTEVGDDLFGLLGEDHVVVLQAPAHLQPAELMRRNGGPGGSKERAFAGVAFLRAMPPDDEADAELIVPVFSHN